MGPFETITIFGGATVDRIAAAVGSTVLGSSNPGTARVHPGGVGLNVARGLARLGHRVRLVSRIGEDTDGGIVMAAARAAGVDMSAVSISETAPTASYHAAFDHHGSLVIGIADMAICDEIAPSEVAAAIADPPDRSLWLVDANLPAATLHFIVSQGEAAHVPLAALTVSPAKAVRLSPHLDRLTLFIANRREAAAVLGYDLDEPMPTATELARMISEAHAPNVVISDGGAPLVVGRHGRTRAFAPFKASVKTVNGGGDGLAAGTIHGLALGHPLFEAALSGLATAAIAIESEGTVSADLSPELVAARIGLSGGDTR
jgi:sugar/nucleoside kinase (ribokinase family)